MHASRLDEPPLLRRIANVSLQEPFSRLRAFYARDAQRFRIYLDAECAMPESWKTAWQAPQQYGKYGNQHWPTKYAAAGFLPHMIANSPFVTADWRAADASVVVLFARHYAAGITIGQQQCLQRLRNRSAAFQATNGSRHFFIFTDSRGPCCLGGEYKDVDFLAHRIIGPHGERYPNTETASFISVWQARDRMRGPNWGPPLRCFDDRKDINFHTPNLQFPRTPFAQPLLPPPPADALRPTLLFYVGSGYPLRRALLDLYQNDTELLGTLEAASRSVPCWSTPFSFLPHLRWLFSMDASSRRGPPCRMRAHRALGAVGVAVVQPARLEQIQCTVIAAEAAELKPCARARLPAAARWRAAGQGCA